MKEQEIMNSLKQAMDAELHQHNRIVELQQQIDEMQHGINQCYRLLTLITIYVKSQKFSCGDDLDGLIHVNDVDMRVSEAKSKISHLWKP